MKILCFLIGFLTLGLLHAQEEVSKKYSWGFNIDQKAGVTNYFTDYLGNIYQRKRLPLSIFVTVTKDKHQFEFGPQAYLFDFNKGQGASLGLGFQYKYYPNGNQNRFNSYISPGLYFHYFSRKGNTRRYDPSIEEYAYGKYHHQGVFGYLASGYGIELKVSKSMYIGTDMRIMFGYGNTNMKDEYPSNSDLNYNGNARYMTFDLQLGLNVGFRF